MDLLDLIIPTGNSMQMDEIYDQLERLENMINRLNSKNDHHQLKLKFKKFQESLYETEFDETFLECEKCDKRVKIDLICEECKEDGYTILQHSDCDSS